MIAITRFDLAFTDTDSSDEDLVYHITRPLASADGTVEHIERPFVMVLQFSQEDINENRILYRPPKEEVGIAEKTVSFEFARKFPNVFRDSLVVLRGDDDCSGFLLLKVEIWNFQQL